MPSLSNKKVCISVCVFLILTAFSFRLFIALRLPNDTPDDGRVYSQIARNILEQHVYSHDASAPFSPSIIRLPGYPLFLAAIYSVFGHSNNAAVRVSQAVLDTATCILIALLAFEWTGDEKLKYLSATAALFLAAVCPFTSVYVGTILTEVPTSFFAVAQVLAATFAFKSSGVRSWIWWLIVGVIAGGGVLFRPDSGLFTAAVGVTILLVAYASAGSFVDRTVKAAVTATLFSLAFCLVLVPWTIRNRRVFHLFQPLAPAHGEMPGEFVPRGYFHWVRTWMSDGRYVGPALWSLDTRHISINSFPDSAFDSHEERDRVSSLLAKYNNTQGVEDEEDYEDSGDEETEQQTSTEPDVEMTPEIDAAFEQLARERVVRAPFRYYVMLPVKRAQSLWFDTHSQYYPFDGELFPLDDLDHGIKQHIWLPLFAGLTWLYTALGFAGAWVSLRSKEKAARIWVMLATLLIFFRIGFFATLENPEPRYVVELFAFLSVLSGIAIAHLLGKKFTAKVET